MRIWSIARDNIYAYFGLRHNSNAAAVAHLDNRVRAIAIIERPIAGRRGGGSTERLFSRRFLFIFPVRIVFHFRPVENVTLLPAYETVSSRFSRCSVWKKNLFVIHTYVRLSAYFSRSSSGSSQTRPPHVYLLIISLASIRDSRVCVYNVYSKTVNTKTVVMLCMINIDVGIRIV